MFMVLKIITFELIAGVPLKDEKKACEWSSTCETAVLRFEIALRDIIQNSLCLILMED